MRQRLPRLAGALLPRDAPRVTSGCVDDRGCSVFQQLQRLVVVVVFVLAGKQAKGLRQQSKAGNLVRWMDAEHSSFAKPLQGVLSVLGFDFTSCEELCGAGTREAWKSAKLTT